MHEYFKALTGYLTLKEEWRPAEEFPGYEVSSFGRVRSLDRIDSGGRRRKGKVLRHGFHSQGYPYVLLRKGGRTYNRKVHRLVAGNFIRPIEPGEVVRHLDDHPENNLLPNLAIGTQADNGADRRRNQGRGQTMSGIPNPPKTHRCPRGHDLLSPLNLVPSALKKGHRACLACSRAFSRNRDHKLGLAFDSPEFQELSDAFYRAILAGFASPEKFSAAVRATVS